MPAPSPLLRHVGDSALIFLLILIGFYAAVHAALTPRSPLSGVAVIYAPWVAADAALSRAVASGARFVRYGAMPFIVVVLPDSADYVWRAVADGAWLVADPRALGGCLNAPEGARS